MIQNPNTRNTNDTRNQETNNFKHYDPSPHVHHDQTRSSASDWARVLIRIHKITLNQLSQFKKHILKMCTTNFYKYGLESELHVLKCTSQQDLQCKRIKIVVGCYHAMFTLIQSKHLKHVKINVVLSVGSKV